MFETRSGKLLYVNSTCIIKIRRGLQFPLSSYQNYISGVTKPGESKL